MFALNDFRSRFSFRQGPALIGFLSVALWVFQAVLGQPLCVCWSNESQGSESENRCETEEIDCPAQLAGSLRSRSRQVTAVRAPSRSLSIQVARRAASVLATARLRFPAGNPAWCCPLRC